MQAEFVLPILGPRRTAPTLVPIGVGGPSHQGRDSGTVIQGVQGPKHGAAVVVGGLDVASEARFGCGACFGGSGR